MASTNCFNNSIVGDLIGFEPIDHPQWRNEDTISTDSMIQDIIENLKLWESRIKPELGDSKTREIMEKMMTKYCEINTDPLKDESTEEVSRKERETRNFRNAISLLEMASLQEQQSESETPYSGLLEESLLRDVNKALMKGVSKPSRTRAGDYSDKMKIMTYNGKSYRYKHPENMESAVMVLVDRYNSLITASLAESSEEAKVKSVFKTAAWLVVEYLHLHPFSDGNGRLCRILCNYVVSTLNMPFPTPIYHIYEYDDQTTSDENVQRNIPCRDDYLRAFVTARMELEPSPPCEMAAIIIESNWIAWQELMKEVYDQKTIN